MTRQRQNLRDRALVSLARVTFRFPVAILIAAALLTAVAGAYTAARLEFHGARDDLVSSRGRHNEIYNDYTSDFGDLDHLVVVADSPNIERAKQFVSALAEEFEERSDLVKEYFFRVSPDELGAAALLYLSPEDLGEIRSRLADYRGFLEDFSQRPSLNSFFELVNREVSAGMVSYLVGNLLGVQEKKDASPVDLTLLTVTLRQMAAALNDPRAYVSPWDRFLSGSNSDFSQDGYLVTENRRFALMLFYPTEEGRANLDEVRKVIEAVRASYPEVEVGLTGQKAIMYAEEQTTARDVSVASVLALVSNLLLLIIPFRALVKPLSAMLTLLVGSVWSFGLATLTVGHLNLLSAVFTSILFGIGINFPIHLTARYQEARRQGRAVDEALEISLLNTGRGVVAAGSIMMLAFCTPVVVGFRGVAELGFISALGLLSCLVAAFTVYPALLTLEDRRRDKRASGIPVSPATVRNRRSRSAGYALGGRFGAPGVVLAVSVGSALLPWPFLWAVSFDENILRLQPQDSEAVVYEFKLLKQGGRSANYAVSITSTLEELRRRQAAFEALPGVYSVRSIDDLVPRDQARKRDILATFVPLLEGVPVLAPQEPLNTERLRRTLGRIDLKLSRGEEEKSWEPGREPDPESIDEARLLLTDIRAYMEEHDGEQTRERLQIFQSRFVADFGDKLDFLRRSLKPEPVSMDSLPTTIRDGFIGKSGRYLVQIYARDDIWEPEARRAFISELRQVDPDVTGGPVIAHEITEVMKTGYFRAAVWSFIVIFLLVLADFRRLGETLLAMIPLIFGAAWTLGAMALFNLDFNLANLFAVPIIIGMAVDNGVNMLYRFREEGSREPLLATAVGKSVTLCSLTTIAGFGALMFAHHQGIASLGLLLTVGVTAVFIATVVVLPAALAWIGPPRRAHRHARRSRRPSLGLDMPGGVEPVEAQSSRTGRTSL